jgi:triacylglycerol lipase
MRRFFPLLFLAACTQSSTLAPSDAGPTPDLAERAPTVWPTGAVDGGATARELPIVLAHGMSGFQNIGPLNYFYGVADALRKDGHDVYVSQVDAFNSSDVRGAELQMFVEGVLRSSGASKVNLICHSQGGFDCRYVAHQIGGSIAAVVTIATPHLGDPIADVAYQVVPGPFQDAMTALLNLFGRIIQGGNPDQDSLKAIQLVSTAGATDFNKRFPDDPRVKYFSIAGRSNSSHGDDACGTPNEAPFVSRWDVYLDPVNPLLAAGSAVLNASFNPTPTNDGVVTVASAKWGTFLGCIPADHLDEVCQIAGQSPGAGNGFECVTFYRQLADWLVARNL